MIKISADKIMAAFLHMSGIAKERRNDYDEIVKNAADFIARKIKSADESDRDRIEFAAVAVAIYDNTVLKLANDKSLCTYDGKQVVNYKDTEQYRFAALLRSNALTAISDLCEESAFAFMAVEG